MTNTPKTAETAATSTSAATEEPKVTYSMSSGLTKRLADLDVSVGFTSYQSSLLYFVGRNPQGGLQVHQSMMPKPMGLSYDGNHSLTVAGGAQIMRFANVLNKEEMINNLYDTCFVPRDIRVTGSLDAHDVGVRKDGMPIFVNTRYNCLATVSDKHSFEVIWKPPFISEVVDEDRCHLNGMAMENGVVKYVTAVSKSNTIDGWRDRRSDGGVIIDVETDKVICEGLSMPHSPRLYNGDLWVLNSGQGELGRVKDYKSGKGKFEPLTFCPGFLRGLSFAGNYAFVGLSKPRHQRFEGLALDQKLKDADSEAWCGVQVIDLKTGSCVDWFRIDGKINELYDIEVVTKTASAMTISPGSSEAAKLITFSA